MISDILEIITSVFMMLTTPRVIHISTRHGVIKKKCLVKLVLLTAARAADVSVIVLESAHGEMKKTTHFFIGSVD